MSGVQEGLETACALVEAGGKVGTGWLVAPDLVATCHHVVDAVPAGGSARLRFRGPDLLLAARVAGADPDSDCAILKLDARAESRAPLPLAGGCGRGAPWFTHGYPSPAGHAGASFAGVVEDPLGRSGGRPALVLFSDQIAAAMAAPAHALAGSPVVVGTAVVGHVTSVRSTPGLAGRPAANEVLACPGDAVLKLLEALGRAAVPPEPSEPAPAEPAPALGGARYHAFVSYRSTDRAFAMDMVGRLEARGFRLYIDQKELLPGDELSLSLQRGLAESRAALALVSRGWLESPWCQQEASVLLHAAVDRGMRVVPLRLDDCELPPMWASKLWIDFAGKPRADDDGLARIVAALAGRPAPAPAPVPSPAVMAKPAGDWGRIEEGGRAASDARLSAAQALVSVGEPRAALALLAQSGDGTRARQLRALALAKSGRRDEAIRELEPLYASGQIDAETGGILGGRYKELWLDGKLAAYLNRSFRVYRMAWERSGDLYPGVNVLATALWLERDAPALLGPSDRAAVAAVAREVEARSEAIREDETDAWRLATRAEVLLIVRRDLDGARRFYALAAAARPEAHQEIAVMRRQARRDLAYLGLGESAVDEALQMPGVVAFTGHMTDGPGRPRPRFPESAVGAVRAALRSLLDRHRVHYGFSSAARGSDILFAEEVLARGGKVTLFLPFPAATFRQTSVDTEGDPRWSARFDALLARAASADRVRLEVLRAEAPLEAERPRAYAACNLAVQKGAIEQAALLDERPRLVAVWDGKPGDGAGGAADAIRDWRDRGVGELDVVDPAR